jgi:hypothetical protein
LCCVAHAKNLAPLSQYPEESEIVSPPLALLEVIKDKEGNFMIHEKIEGGGGRSTVLVKEIHVNPTLKQTESCPYLSVSDIISNLITPARHTELFRIRYMKLWWLA